LKKASPARRKSKPKFEIPVETGLPQAPVGWVYRAEEASPPLHKSGETSKTNPFLKAGMGLILIGVGTIGLISVTTLGIISAPLRLAQQAFTSD
jgi:hypothetical protein